MSWHFSQALVEEYLVANSLGRKPFAPSKSSPTPQAYLSSDRMTAFSTRSLSGMIFLESESFLELLGAIPYKNLCNFALENDVSMDWILFGKTLETPSDIDPSFTEFTLIPKYKTKLSRGIGRKIRGWFFYFLPKSVYVDILDGYQK